MNGRRQQGRTRDKNRFRPCCEPLEGLLLMATVTVGTSNLTTGTLEADGTTYPPSSRENYLQAAKMSGGQHMGFIDFVSTNLQLPEGSEITKATLGFLRIASHGVPADVQVVSLPSHDDEF